MRKPDEGMLPRSGGFRIIYIPDNLFAKRISLLLLLLVAFFNVTAQTAKVRDTIFFKTGSIVVGELDKVKVGVVNFDPDDANDITIQLLKLKTISATRTIFRIETNNHHVYFGKLVAHPMSEFVRVVELTDTVVINVQDISMLYPFKNSFFKRFSGSLGAGFSYTRSSDFGQMNFNGKLAYTAKKEEISLSASGIYSLTDSTFSRDREDITLKYNYYFSPTWFGTLALTYQRNLELGLERRYQEAFGAGNKFLTSKHVYAWGRSGLALNQERSNLNVSSGTLSELFAQLEFNFFRFTKPEINVVLTDAFFYSLSQSGRVRNDGELDLYWELIKDLKLDLTFYHNFDSRPPGKTSHTSDLGIVVGLNFTF